MKFRSAIDMWFIVLALGVPVLVFGYVTRTLWPLDFATILTMLGAAALSLGLPIWLMFSTVYEIRSDQLVVRSGPLTWKIPRDAITDVRPSRSLLSSPALSLKRLRIDYGEGKYILISPADIDGFRRALRV